MSTAPHFEYLRVPSAAAHNPNPNRRPTVTPLVSTPSASSFKALGSPLNGSGAGGIHNVASLRAAMNRNHSDSAQPPTSSNYATRPFSSSLYGGGGGGSLSISPLRAPPPPLPHPSYGVGASPASMRMMLMMGRGSGEEDRAEWETASQVSTTTSLGESFMRRAIVPVRSISRPGAPLGDDDDAQDDGDDDAVSVASTASLPVLPSDDVPVVPADLMAHCAEPFRWQNHPAAAVVLSLLNARGAFLPAHRELVEYHMAPRFLNALHQLTIGSYFVKYTAKRSPPKERFFNVQMLPNVHGVHTPHLCWRIHQGSMQLVDSIPMTQLIGVSTGVNEVAFHRYLVTTALIKGCKQGNRNARLSTSGAFTLWLYDAKRGTSRSLSILTCSPHVFSLWISSLEGLVSVNSVLIRDVVMEQQRTNSHKIGGGSVPAPTKVPPPVTPPSLASVKAAARQQDMEEAEEDADEIENFDDFYS